MTPPSGAALAADQILQMRASLLAIPGLTVLDAEPLSRHVRFGIGGPARLFADTAHEDSFISALACLRGAAVAWTVIGGGTNLVPADAGYAGVVLRYNGAGICRSDSELSVAAGAPLQSLVDCSLAHGLAGIDKLTGIPGSAGGAVYGNAGAYGQSISDTLRSVRFFDGECIREFDSAGCEFRYRESVFKRRKQWLILSATFALQPSADAAAMRTASHEILAVRNAKFPPEMQCAGSIFKNLLLAELPPTAQAAVPDAVVKKGKVPAAWFLDAAGGRGLHAGGIHVADYHANLLYNAGGGTASELRELIADLKQRAHARFGFWLEEEVQFL